MSATVGQRAFLLLQHLLPRRGPTRLMGRLARSRRGWLAQVLIRRFVATYDIDLAEAEEPDPRAYASFGDFFVRTLKPDARPLPEDPRVLASPCDGTVSAAGRLEGERLLQVKGIDYSVADLLDDPALARRFADGRFATLYLAPADYHRVHMPLDGTLTGMRYVPGALFSVNPATVATRRGLFARNERVVCTFDGPSGAWAMVLVGATIVGGIRTVWAGRVTPRTAEGWQVDLTTPPRLRRGDEMGRFEIGSTVVLLFRPGRVDWAEALQPGRRCRMGEPIGELAATPPDA